MECMKLFGLDFSLGLNCKVNLFLLFLLLLLFTFLFTWTHSKPFWKLGLGSLVEFCKFFLPGRFQCFGPQDFSSSFIKLFPVSICPCISSALILGEHMDGGRVGACERLRV